MSNGQIIWSEGGEPADGTIAAGTIVVYNDAGTMKQKDSSNVVSDLTNTSGAGDVAGPASATDNAVSRFNGTTGKIIQNSGVLIDDSDNITGVTEITVSSLPLHFFAAHTSNTGIINGGGDLSINADTTKFDISDGRGYITDIFTDPDNPVITEVVWTGLTAIAATFVATDNLSFIAINSSGTVIQQTAEFDLSDHRDLIIIGAIFHPNLVITATNDDSDAITTYLAHDLTLALGDINIFGNNFNAASTDLTIRKEGGQSFRVNSNRLANPKAPNNLSSSVINPLTFVYIHDNGSGGIATITGQTNIDPNQYDDGSGTLAAVANNKWTNQQCYFFPGSGVILIRFGNIIYSSKADAEDDFARIPPTIGTGLDPELVRTVLTVKKGETDLTSSDTVFSPTGKFGLAGGGAGGTGGTFQDLQDTYNNSVDPEILTDTTRGALTIRRGSAADTDNVLEVENNAGTKNFEITGTGDVDNAGSTVTVGDITGATINATGDTAAGDSAVLGFTATEGAILAGQGSINDVTIKNDADATVLSIPTGTINVDIAGDLDVTGDILNLPESIGVAASDETTDLTTGTAKTTFRMPFAMTVTDVRASVTTAPTGSVLTVDINESGTTILSTKITIDATEKTSTTAATPPVISDSSLADDAEITIDIDTIGSTIAGAGLKVWIIGNRT